MIKLFLKLYAKYQLAAQAYLLFQQHGLADVNVAIDVCKGKIHGFIGHSFMKDRQPQAYKHLVVDLQTSLNEE
jgi:hypothetical protein